MPGPLLLLPPSEGKAAGGAGRWRPGSGAPRSLGPRRAEVVAHLVDAVGADPTGRVAAKLFGGSEAIVDRAVQCLEAIAAGRAPTLPAWQRYTGVVWEHLQPATLDPDALARVLVPSGLLGLAAATDPVPDHRLKMSVNVPGLGRLDHWWRDAVTKAIRARAKALGASTIVDLLPLEHAAAVDFDALRRAGLEVVPVRFVAADQRAVGHGAKAAKGAFARRLLLEGLDAASTFRHHGATGRAAVDGSIEVVLA